MGFVFQSLSLELSIIIFSLACFYLYNWSKKKFRFFLEKGVQHVPPAIFSYSSWKPFLGQTGIFEAHKELYFKLKGAKIGGVYVVFTPLFLVRDPELIERVLIKDFSHFHDRGVKVDSEVNPLEGHLFFLSGDKWRALRAKLSPTFTSGKLKWMFQQLDSCADSLLKTIDDETKNTDGEIEAKDLLSRFTTDVIGSCVFGLETESIKDPNCKFRKVSSAIFNPTFKEIIIASFRFAFPSIFFRFKIRTIPKEINDFFINLLKDMFEHRKSTGRQRKDFVELLLQLREKGSIDFDPKEVPDDDDIEENYHDKDHDGKVEEKVEMTDNLLAAQAFVFFTAGFETSATSLAFTLYFLAKNQKTQEKARKEVREVKARHHGKITYQGLKEMQHVENCLKEAMRLYPPISAMFRECTKSIEMDGIKIDKGSLLVIQAVGIHSDPEFYKNPEEYRPERFEEGEGSIPGTFMPFGDGPRICIGKRFAMVEIKLALARLLDNYVIEPSPKLTEPIKLNPRSFVTQPVSGLWVKFKKISQEA